MELIFEFLMELILEGSIEASRCKKIPKVIRIFLIAFITLFFLTIIGLISFVGFVLLKQNLLAGIFFILVGLFMFIMSIIQFRKLYLSKEETK